jgi:leucyl aminopeptidase (aminopeptidase T)
VELEKCAAKAAETIFRQCLDLPKNGEIVILADETTIATASILAEVAIEQKLNPILTYFTVQMQTIMGKAQVVPALASLLDGADATLICLNNKPQCLAFRDNIRRIAWNPGCKVAHMPGINLNTIVFADVDYQALNERCEMIALVLAKGQKVEIKTRDHQGNEYSLKTKLNPWMRLPIISDGVIQTGAWGNVPSGETYIAPPEGIAEGTIVINGSVSGYCINPGEEIFLHFQKGRLVAWEPLDSPAMEHLLHEQIEYAQSENDQNWSNLAEIGIGANPLVKKPIGNPLLDEKVYGSLHIALGDNTDMGGDVTSKIHCNLVTLLPTLLVDDKLILEGGEIKIDPGEWLENFKSVNLPEHWHADISIQSTVTNAQKDEDGRLKRLWDTSAGGICSVPVGSDETARIATKIYRYIKDFGQSVKIRDLTGEYPECDLSQLVHLTYILNLYDLVSIDGEVS